MQQPYFLYSYCPKLNASGTLISKSSGRSYGCLTNVNYQSSNLIYVITCKSCNIQYLGQTKNRLLTRFQGHHFDINVGNDTTVARHFNKCPKSQPAKFDGIQISIVSFIRAGEYAGFSEGGGCREEGRGCREGGGGGAEIRQRSQQSKQARD